MEVVKEKYYHNKVNKLMSVQKVYCCLLKIFLISKKTPILPTLLYENHFITDFKEKALLFNIFFSK